MALHDITCAGCGDATRVRVITTEYCFKCRILNEWHADELDPANEEFHKKHKEDPLPRGSKENWKLHPRTCICGRVFWPLRKSHRACYYCTDARAGRRLEHECGNCHKHNQPAPGVPTACRACVASSYKYRRAYLFQILVERSLAA